MSQYQQLLLIADAARPRSAAFERAAWLARTTGARLHVSAFDHQYLIDAAGVIDQDSARHAREAWLQRIDGALHGEAARLQAEGVQVSTQAQWSRHPEGEILAQVREFKPDLVIKDVQFESRLRRALFKPLDRRLIRECPAPLLFVHSSGGGAMRRVAAAVDVAEIDGSASEFNDQIISAALGLSIQADAELHLVHVFDGVSVAVMAMPDALPVVSGELYETLLAADRERFQKLAEAHGVPARRRHFLTGPTAATLADFIKKRKIDVLVVGSLQRGALERILLIGSTTEELLDRAACDILTVKPSPAT